jgi:hydrogenase maturation protein HypF
MSRKPSRIKSRAARVVVFGVVQGVGFRPFVYRIARELGYRGWVKNIGPGVEIHLESDRPGDFRKFVRRLERERPPLARIESLTLEPAAARECRDFRVRKSGAGESFVFISPDIATCRPCLEEILTPGERRFGYPFTNCTDCGPRYTIVKSLPYDRARTTMARFRMCPDCRREYSDPADRRYHAQPIACPVCGPKVTLLEARSGQTLEGGIERAAALIRKGRILAVKGLGGFHLVCDPWNTAAVGRLRKIKERRSKPLALMAAGIAAARRVARVSEAEKNLLLSLSRPIVLLRKKRDIPLIAPGLNEVGIMLAYTPLHHLLLRDLGLIVATSSNKKDSPIMKEREPGLARLCDYILDHNRPIEMRADDSVAKVAAGRPLLVRRARGYVPYPQRVPAALRVPGHVLALGGELKDTVSVYKNGYVITSQFLGDLDEYENRKYLREALGHLRRLFDVRPCLVVSDLHPDFHTTRLAASMGLPHLRVQHHFAHVLAPMLEHQVPPGEKVLGVSLDGYGYGADGGAWGGEFLVADYGSFERYAHLAEAALPGGDLAARQPWRMAVAYLRRAFGPEIPDLAPLRRVGGKRVRALEEIIDRELNSPPTSSCGRLFDAASFILGLAPLEMEYEAEAAMRLEAEASRSRTAASYPVRIIEGGPSLEVSLLPAIRGLVRDAAAGPPARPARKFHNTVARAVLLVAERARRERGLRTVAIVGGVFLNRILVEETEKLLKEAGFRVLTLDQYSPGDESLSLGQVAFGLNWLTQGKSGHPRPVKKKKI